MLIQSELNLTMKTNATLGIPCTQEYIQLAVYLPIGFMTSVRISVDVLAVLVRHTRVSCWENLLGVCGRITAQEPH